MKDPFKYLDEEEKDMMESVERGEWRRIANFDAEKKKAEAAAKATSAGTEKINISKQDIDRLKNRALEQGVPYESLVSGIIHKYLAEQQI
ncbi:MAG: antitoxin [Desulfococcaceae bacterium]|jgi:predicted DNA binding CopG/RHH family protein|nr:antitoxin [Desulfococcaceae bacterium]